jgi:hypothetical protein
LVIVIDAFRVSFEELVVNGQQRHLADAVTLIRLAHRGPGMSGEFFYGLMQEDLARADVDAACPSSLSDWFFQSSVPVDGDRASRAP